MSSFKYACLYLSLLAVIALPVHAQEEIIQETKPKATEQDRTVAALKWTLGRAQQVRVLSAEHLAFLDSKRATPEVHMLEEAAQVMAYSLICDDKAMDAKTLNIIANESTLKIALLFEQSDVGQKIAADSKGQPDQIRLTLIADVASAALMFKIGRRRGLFDALMTDFGQTRFCAGLGPDMRTRYNNLAAGLQGH